MKPETLAELHKFQHTVERLERAASGSAAFGEEMRGRLGMLRRAIQQTATETRPLLQEADAIEHDLTTLMIALRGDAAMRALNEQTPASILDRIGAATNSQRFANSAPSATSRNQYAIAAAEFADALKQLKAIHARFESLERRAEQAGAPWTSGRIPEWQPE
jgi:hypothetical protein